MPQQTWPYQPGHTNLLTPHTPHHIEILHNITPQHYTLEFSVPLSRTKLMHPTGNRTMSRLHITHVAPVRTRHAHNEIYEHFVFGQYAPAAYISSSNHQFLSGTNSPPYHQLAPALPRASTAPPGECHELPRYSTADGPDPTDAPAQPQSAGRGLAPVAPTDPVAPGPSGPGPGPAPADPVPGPDPTAQYPPRLPHHHWPQLWP